MCSDQPTLIQMIREVRHKDGLYCPKCQSNWVVKYGYYKETQKYHCNSCLGYFNDLSGTLFAHCRIKDKILPYLDCMQRSYSLKQSEKAIGVCYVNLFYWRHRIAKAFAENETQLLSSVMCSHTHMNESCKGQNADIGRQPYQRGYSPTVDYCCRKKITVFCATDKAKNHLIFHLPSKNPSNNHFTEIVSRNTMNSTHWITSPGRVYEKFCKAMKLKHTEVCGYGDENTPNVRDAHLWLMELRLWLEIFQGVATKYLNNYLKWFSTLQLLSLDQADTSTTSLFSKVVL